MYEGIIFAGFGGQGILLAGRLLCIAAMSEGKYVSHIPSYGAEMRGGTANCIVIVSDDPIGSPLVSQPSVCVVLNQPSATKFAPTVRPGGLLVWNSSLIHQAPARSDIRYVEVPANEMAEAAGSFKAANMVVLGALLRARPAIASVEAVFSALQEAVSARHRELNEINRLALRKGYEIQERA